MKTKMAAEAVIEELKHKIRRLQRKEKIKLFSEVISESHPAFRVGKRGKTRSFGEAKHKLRKDFRLALMEKKNKSLL